MPKIQPSIILHEIESSVYLNTTWENILDIVSAALRIIQN